MNIMGLGTSRSLQTEGWVGLGDSLARDFQPVPWALRGHHPLQFYLEIFLAYSKSPFQDSPASGALALSREVSQASALFLTWPRETEQVLLPGQLEIADSRGLAVWPPGTHSFPGRWSLCVQCERCLWSHHCPLQGAPRSDTVSMVVLRF